MAAKKFKNFYYEFPKMLYRWLKILSYLTIGMWKVFKLKEPRVTFFGSARLQADDPYFFAAKELAQKLVEKNFSVMTGGGPGVMEAANAGASLAAKKRQEFRSFAIGIKIPWEMGLNTFAQDSMMTDSLFTRKWLLINYSCAFIVFPGGFGTFEELSEVLSLIEIKKFPEVPVILFGKEFWAPYMDLIRKSALKNAFVNEDEIKLIRVTDDINEVVNIIVKSL